MPDNQLDTAGRRRQMDTDAREEHAETMIEHKRTQVSDMNEPLLEAVIMDFIAEWKAGKHPNLATYMQLYPNIADEFQAYIVYYLFEGRNYAAEMAQERTSPDYAARLAVRAADPTFQDRKVRLFTKLFASPEMDTSAMPTPLISSLLAVAAEKGIDLDTLSGHLGLSFDLVFSLEQRMVELVHLPRLLVTNLAKLLEVPPASILHYLQGPSAEGAFHMNTGVPTVGTQQDFATWIVQSSQLTAEQKAQWLQEVEADAYTATEIAAMQE